MNTFSLLKIEQYKKPTARKTPLDMSKLRKTVLILDLKE